MKTILFVRVALWSLCVYIFVACGQQPDAQSFTSTNNAFAEPVVSHGVETADLTEATVYVCHSSGAKKYHLKQNCGGLKRCKHEIITMSSHEAEKIGLGLCGYEN